MICCATVFPPSDRGVRALANFPHALTRHSVFSVDYPKHTTAPWRSVDLDTADAADTRAADASRELQQELAAARAAERDLEAQVRGSAEIQILL